MNTSTFLVAGVEGGNGEGVRQAVRRVAPGAQLIPVAGVDEALGRVDDGSEEGLILVDPAQAEVERALAAAGPAGRSRWPVVVFVRAAGPAGSSESPASPGTGLRVNPLVGKAADGPGLEEALRTAVALSRLSRENARLRGDLRTVASRISHDLRTPLGCIAITADAVREALPPALPENASLARSIADSSDEMARILERVSFVLKASLGDAPLGPVEMGEVVFGAVNRFDRPMAAKGAVLRQPPAWPRVAGVSAWLDVVWRNLLENSLRHGGPAPRIELGWGREGAVYRFWVRDSGPGVPPAKRGQLFVRFEGLHAPNSSRGLGLPIIQRLAELQGGGAGFEADRESGAGFYFTLPVPAETPQP